MVRAENATGTILDTDVSVPGSLSFSVQDNGLGYLITVTDDFGCVQTIDQLGIESCMTVDIELTAFDGEVTEEGNKLRWTTATEWDNDYFTLMHSTDGFHFEAIAHIDGAGNSSTLKHYEFLHQDAPAGISYYQLLQTDFDGTTTTAPSTVTLTRQAVDLAFVQLNTLITDLLVVTFTNNRAQTVCASIVDLSGRVIETEMIEANEGNTTFNMSLRHLPKGMYLLSLSNGEQVVTTKLIKGN